MPYNFVVDGFHTKKVLCSWLSSSAILHGKRPFCVFEPPLGGFGTTYDVQLLLIGKLIVEFLLVIIELFLLAVTAEVPRANMD